jgi:hypothetical protein
VSLAFRDNMIKLPDVPMSGPAEVYAVWAGKKSPIEA